MSRHSSKGFMIGAVVGSILGGVTALILAPKSGNKLRKDLVRKCDEMSEKTQDLVCEVSDQAKCLVERAKEMADDAKEAAQEIMKEFKKR